jgi:hypothetical protein
MSHENQPQTMDLRRMQHSVATTAQLPDWLAAAGSQETHRGFVVSDQARQDRDLLDGLRQASANEVLGSSGVGMKWKE